MSELAPIGHAVDLDLPPPRAFELILRLGDWWPIAYTFAGARFADARIDPRAGRWYERAQDGSEESWGELRACEPPHRLVLAFAVSAGRTPEAPDRASEVELCLSAQGADRPRVEVEHRQLERHGEGADTLRAGLDSDQGWPLILAELRRAAAREHRAQPR
jgi:uncharacterized protein YndB with AHSA1/START domain